IGIPGPTNGRPVYNISCPCCDDNPRKKHLNINLNKDVFCCPRCHFSGGVFDLYSYYSGVDRKLAREVLMEKLGLKDSGSTYDGSKHKQERRTIQRPILQDIELPLTDIDARHETYAALLGKLSLASDHRENLLSRGLTDELIRDYGYKTMPVVGFSALAKQLQSEGYYLGGVPGFYHTKEGAWTFIHERRGILIPARDQDGKIQGLQIRLDNVKKGKFRWISSIGKQDGCKAEGWTHLKGEPTQTVLLTEGPLKADVINHITGLTVVAVPGVNSLKHLQSTLEYLQSQGTTKIMTCFDMDYLKNPHVRDGYYNLANILAGVGIEYGTYLWDPQFKGLDDYVWHCRKQGTL
ncbi:MAG: DUF3854 domain-containing protein, partial [Oscillospiraceae bacterium]|nr:DUF3854 domain-containing protein [Oscillospiraceae bacterium]